MELEKFEQKQVAAISVLQAKSNELKLKADSIDVNDEEGLKLANQLVKDINAHKKDVKEKRLALTQPLNNVVNQLIAKEKEVLLPLDEGKTEVSEKILDYSAEVERKRAEEVARIEEIQNNMRVTSDTDIPDVSTADSLGAHIKKFYEDLSEEDQGNPAIKVTFMTSINFISEAKNRIIEEEKAEAERKRQAEEQKRLDEAAAKQSAEEQRIAAERKEVEDQKRQIEEDKAQMIRDKEELERQKEIQKAEAEALKAEKAQAKLTKAAPKSNIITNTKFEIINPSAVPYIYCSPDEKKIRQAIYDGYGENILGVRIYEETKVR